MFVRFVLFVWLVSGLVACLFWHKHHSLAWLQTHYVAKACHKLLILLPHLPRAEITDMHHDA